MQQGRIALCISISNDQFTSIIGQQSKSQEHLRSANMAVRRGHHKMALLMFSKVKKY